MLNVVIFITLLASVTLYALLRGGSPERIVAAILLLGVAASAAVPVSSTRVFEDREVALIAVDITMLVALLCVALRAERIWPLCLVSFIIVGIELQIGMWLAPQHHRQVYKIVHGFSGYPVLILLAIGTARHRKRLARLGFDRSWTQFGDGNR